MGIRQSKIKWVETQDEAFAKANRCMKRKDKDYNPADCSLVLNHDLREINLKNTYKKTNQKHKCKDGKIRNVWLNKDNGLKYIRRIHTGSGDYYFQKLELKPRKK